MAFLGTYLPSVPSWHTVIGVAYAFGIGRIGISQKMLAVAVWLTVGVGLLGLLFGFVFAKTRGFIGLLNVYSQGIVAASRDPSE